MKSKSFLIWGLLLIALCLSGQAGAKPYELLSPNGKLSVVINDGDRLTYQVSFAGQLLMEPSAIGMKLMNGKVIGENLRLASPRVRKKTENISSPFYRVRSFTTTYNEVDFRLEYGFGVIFRAYDEGIAYRFYTTQKKETTIADEIVEVKFVSDRISLLCFGSEYTCNVIQEYLRADTPLEGIGKSCGSPYDRRLQASQGHIDGK